LKICGPWLDFIERQGVLRKSSRDFLVSDLFFNEKSRWTRSTTHGLLEALVHGGPWPWPTEELTGYWPSGCSGARWLTGDGATKRGEHEESISGLTEARAVVWRPGDGGEETAVVVLSGGGARAQREGKESRRGVVEDGRALPFYRGRGGGRPVVKAEEWPALMGDETTHPLVAFYSAE
jgi:hypothetical protein